MPLGTLHHNGIVDSMRRHLACLVLPLALALAVSSAAQAQTIGFKIGASMANPQFNPDVETNALVSLGGGGFVRFGAGRLGVELEALSITKGAEFEFDGSKLKIEYIEVPLLLHLPLTLGQSFAPYVIAGPSIAFDVDCEGELSEGEPFKCDDREKTDFGLSAGGGLGFAAGPGALL